MDYLSILNVIVNIVFCFKSALVATFFGIQEEYVLARSDLVIVPMNFPYISNNFITNKMTSATP